MINEVEKSRLLERLMSKIEIDEKTCCWNWTGTLSRGYGLLSSKFGKTPFKAHRLSYELHVGEIPDGLLLRHTCDNPRCCNPAHLLPGTHKQNAIDKSVRSRMNPKSFLNLHPGEKGKFGAGTKSNKELGKHVSQ